MFTKIIAFVEMADGRRRTCVANGPCGRTVCASGPGDIIIVVRCRVCGESRDCALHYCVRTARFGSSTVPAVKVY